MHLWLADRMVRDHTEPKQFFRIAHVWRFERDVDVSRDVLTYKVGGIIPQYVQEFVRNIQQKESRK